MIRYFDPSAMAKRYLEEEGGAAVARWIASGSTITSRISLVEVSSAISRGVRRGRVTEAEAAALEAAFDEDLRSIDLVEVSEPVLRRARSLVARHPLRAGDAIHLASALHLKERSARPVVLVAYDGELLRAARAEGLETLGGS